MKKVFTIALVIYIGFDLLAQCNDPPPAECPCQTEVICGLNDLDDYCLTMANFNTPFGAFPGCPANGLENPNWFSFVAGTNTLSLTISQTNCTGGGIQSVIYEASDIIPDLSCNTCNPSDYFGSGDVLAAQCACTLSPIVWAGLPTTPGVTYYVVIDGCGGTVCDVEIDIVMGGGPTKCRRPWICQSSVCRIHHRHRLCRCYGLQHFAGRR